ncbi:MAG: uL15 family ribosomal protein [Candidatus Aenigmarchaeota archaeon]|nr:uL15 family ribosomal protein [Candidatus Aenigmarchaeota archaeon]
MAAKRAKSRKMRGSKTHGYGFKKKHRGKGSKGGKGRAGRFGQKFLHYLKKEGRPGKHGFKGLGRRKLEEKDRAIGLRDIEMLANRHGIKEINSEDYGYQKVLASGTITLPLTIKAKRFTKRAEEKILKAGGRAVKAE